MLRWKPVILLKMSRLRFRTRKVRMKVDHDYAIDFNFYTGLPVTAKREKSP